MSEITIDKQLQVIILPGSEVALEYDEPLAFLSEPDLSSSAYNDKL